MTDIETIHYNIAQGQSAIRDIVAMTLNDSFSDLNQVQAAQESLYEIRAAADQMHNFIIGSLPDENTILAARNDPNQIVSTLLDGCAALRSDADIAYQLIANHYQFDGLQDQNDLVASDMGMGDGFMPDPNDGFAQDYLNNQVTAANQPGFYGDLNANEITAAETESLFNFLQ